MGTVLTVSPLGEFPGGCIPIHHRCPKTSRKQFTTTFELCYANSMLNPGLVFLTSQISSGPGINSKRSEGNRRAIEKTSTSFSDANFDAHRKALSKTPENTLPTLKTDQTRHVGMVKTKMMRKGDWKRFVREILCVLRQRSRRRTLTLPGTNLRIL